MRCNKVRSEEPDLFDPNSTQIDVMLDEAVECEMQFAADILSGGVAGLSVGDMKQYLESSRPAARDARHP